MPSTDSKTPQKPLRGTKVGTVTSDKRNKTRTVVVSYQSKHPKYGKFVHRRSTYQVHDPDNTSKSGDRVEIAVSRPVSKTKNWRLLRVIEAAPIAESYRAEA